MQSPDCDWGGDGEGKLEAGRKPIDDAGVCGVEVCGSVGDGGEREPLRRKCQSQNILTGL